LPFFMPKKEITMGYKEGLADRFGHQIPVQPYLQRYKQGYALQFCPDYQYLVGEEAIEEMGREMNGSPSRIPQLKRTVLANLPLLKSRIRRTIIRLILERNKSLDEIADILGCTYENVYYHLYGDPRYANSGAISQLRRILAQAGNKQKLDGKAWEDGSYMRES